MEVSVPVVEADGNKWLDLRGFDRKIVFRASNIENPRRKSDSNNQHHFFESTAEGGVKCRPKRWVIL